MIPVRIIRTEADLAAVTADSLVCPAYDVGSVYQSGGRGVFSEPGVEEDHSAAAVWEMSTGAYETQVLDEEREMWVIWDAAAPGPSRPSRGEDSPDWLSVVPGRVPRMIAHMTRAEAVGALNEALVNPPADEVAEPRLHVSLWRRTKQRHDFYLVNSTPQGTAPGTHAWNPAGGAA